MPRKSSWGSTPQRSHILCAPLLSAGAFTMSKIANTHIRSCITKVLEGAEEKKRGFLETIELQIGLKNYDPQKDKRFAGNIKLPHIPRPKMRICVLGDAFHCEKAASLGIDHKNADGLKNFNKNKKLIKKFGACCMRALPGQSLLASCAVICEGNLDQGIHLVSFFRSLPVRSQEVPPVPRV